MKRTLIIIAMLLSIQSFGQGNVGLQVDTIYMLPEVKVTAQFLNDTDRYRYNQMKFYVTTILPYLDAATKVF